MKRVEWHRRKGRSSSSWIRKTTRWAIYFRDGFNCVWCRSVSISMACEELTLDHVVPRSEGGSNRPGNLVSCCRRCNFARGAKALLPAERRAALRQAKKSLCREVGIVLSAIYSPLQPSKRVRRLGRPAASPIRTWWREAGEAVLE